MLVIDGVLLGTLAVLVQRGVIRGGSIRMRSTTRPGKSGTCFSIFLPQQTQKMDVKPQ